MSSIFYRNRRLLILTICLILVSGLSALHVLPRMEDPVLTSRVANINTLFPGADAERVESLVTEKIEEELQDVGVEYEDGEGSVAGDRSFAERVRGAQFSRGGRAAEDVADDDRAVDELRAHCRRVVPQPEVLALRQTFPEVKELYVE